MLMKNLAIQTQARHTDYSYRDLSVDHKRIMRIEDNIFQPTFHSKPVEQSVIALSKQVIASMGDAGGMDATGSQPYDAYQIKLEPKHLNNRSAFVQQVAKHFNNSQDAAHNAILEYLLNTTYAPNKTSNINHQSAHAAMFDSNNNFQAGRPLHFTRNKQQATTVQNSQYFIRDYMQLNTKGGSSAKDPVTVTGKNIQDGILNKSSFEKSFEELVDEINNKIKTEGLSGEVQPMTKMAHRDGIQLIPSATNARYVGDIMRHVSITQNRIQSSGALQGIFATDGLFKNMEITNNKISTGGKHTIAINGFLSGKISGNTELNGELLKKHKIVLSPLRLGGGANIYVLSFNNNKLEKTSPDYYAYEPLEKGSQEVTDNREKRVSKTGATHWHHVDVPHLNQDFKQWETSRKGAGQSVSDKDMKMILPVLLKQQGAREV